VIARARGARESLIFSLSDQLFSVVFVVKNKFPLVFRGVDSYLQRFTSSHGQNLLLTHSAAPPVVSPQHFDHVMT
jgi:hypothetical protein